MSVEALRIKLLHKLSNNNSRQCPKFRNLDQTKMRKLMRIKMYREPTTQLSTLISKFLKTSKIFSNIFKDISHKR
jgi:hypothetical protein